MNLGKQKKKQKKKKILNVNSGSEPNICYI